MIVILLS